MKKFLLFLVLVVIVAVAVAGVIGYTQMDRIVKSGVETFGPKVLQAPVTLDDVHISPWSGKGELSGLTVSNPEGFKTDHAIKLGSLRVEVDLASLKTDVVHIKEIYVDAAEITVEGLKGKNLKKLQENAAAFSGKPAQEKPKVEDSGKPAKKVIIDNIIFKDGKINFSPALGQSIPIALPDLHLTAIGEASGGATAGEVIKQLLTQIDDAVFGAITGAGKLVGDAALGSLKLAGKGAMEGAQIVGDVGAAGAKAAGKVDDIAVSAVTGAAGAVTDVAGGGAKAVGKVADVGTEAITGAAGKATDAIGGAGKMVKGLGGILGGKDKPQDEEPTTE